MSLLVRRRGMMGRGDTSPLDGYVTDGLIFFLDAQNANVVGNEWTDLIGGRTFALTNCTDSGNGIMFDGSSSYGIYAGAISFDYSSETIEAYVSPTRGREQYVLVQPKINNLLGISLAQQQVSISQMPFGFIADGSTHAMYCIINNLTARISMNNELSVCDESRLTKTYNSFIRATTGNYTIIGARKAGTAFSGYFTGAIKTIRIYDRKLTADEMIQNQRRDLERYG